MAFISENIISEGNLSGNTLNVNIATIDTINGITSLSKLTSISADTFYITTTPTNNNSATQILSRNTSTGVVEYRDSSTFGSSTNVFSTLSAGTITLTSTPTSNASATQILARNSTTGTIEYRDYSTFAGGSGGSSGDTYVTGFTYSNNNLTISQNGGQADLSVNISTMTGLTITGDLSASTIFITTNPTLNNNNTEILTLNTTTNRIEYSDASSTAIYNYGVSFAMSTSNFLT